MAGADLTEIDLLDKSNTTIIFDNEPRNLQIVRKYFGALKLGWKIVVWPEGGWGEPKDINEMILNGSSADKILKIINKNTYSGQRGEWEVRMWKV